VLLCLQTSNSPARKRSSPTILLDGLYYYGARYYDAGIGRFISADTVISDPMNPQAFNRYSYCLNNPLKYTDPLGHEVDIEGKDVKKIYQDTQEYDYNTWQQDSDVLSSAEFRAYDFYKQHDQKTFAALEMQNQLLVFR